MIAQALQKRVQTYLDLAELSRNDHSVETIHDFRVSSRNLLAVEPLLRCVSETSQWKKMVRKYLKSLSQLRDTQVLHGNLYGHDQFDTLLLVKNFSKGQNVNSTGQLYRSIFTP